MTRTTAGPVVSITFGLFDGALVGVPSEVLVIRRVSDGTPRVRGRSVRQVDQGGPPGWAGAPGGAGPHRDVSRPRPGGLHGRDPMTRTTAGPAISIRLGLFELARWWGCRQKFSIFAEFLTAPPGPEAAPSAKPIRGGPPGGAGTPGGAGPHRDMSRPRPGGSSASDLDDSERLGGTGDFDHVRTGRVGALMGVPSEVLVIRRVSDGTPGPEAAPSAKPIRGGPPGGAGTPGGAGPRSRHEQAAARRGKHDRALGAQGAVRPRLA